jgi:hypothetical protein
LFGGVAIGFDTDYVLTRLARARIAGSRFGKGQWLNPPASTLKTVRRNALASLFRLFSERLTVLVKRIR